MLLPARSALAEPQLVRAEPPNDAVLDDAPARVELWFDQPLVSDFAATEVTLVPAGASTEIRPLYAAVDHRDPTRLLISPPQALRDGRYLVKWRITSVQDGSVGEGEYSFSIAATAAPGSEGESGPDILLLSLLTLAGIGGGAILGLLLYLFRRALGLGGHPTSETTLPEHH